MNDSSASTVVSPAMVTVKVPVELPGAMVTVPLLMVTSPVNRTRPDQVIELVIIPE